MTTRPRRMSPPCLNYQAWIEALCPSRSRAISSSSTANGRLLLPPSCSLRLANRPVHLPPHRTSRCASSSLALSTAKSTYPSASTRRRLPLSSAMGCSSLPGPVSRASPQVVRMPVPRSSLSRAASITRSSILVVCLMSMTVLDIHPSFLCSFIRITVPIIPTSLLFHVVPAPPLNSCTIPFSISLGLSFKNLIFLALLIMTTFRGRCGIVLYIYSRASAGRAEGIISLGTLDTPHLDHTRAVATDNTSAEGFC